MAYLHHIYIITIIMSNKMLLTRTSIWPIFTERYGRYLHDNFLMIEN